MPFHCRVVRLCVASCAMFLLAHCIQASSCDQDGSCQDSGPASGLPTHMRAIRMIRTGGPEELVLDEAVPVPVPTATQLLLQVHSAGLNYIDTYHRTGLYPVQLPFTPGRECAGLVVAVGSHATTNFKSGDRVACLAGATYAEYTVAEAKRCAQIPDTFGLEEAGGFLIQGLTAHYLTRSSYPIKPGDTVLIHAAAGGTGGMLVQMAKLRGALVIGTVGTDEKAAIAQSLGADHTIVYTREDFLQRTRELTDGKGVHAVYDGVGKPTWEKSMKSLRRRGYLVLFGNAGGAVPPIDPLTLTKHGSLFVTRPSLYDHVDDGEFELRCVDLMNWLADGSVGVRVVQRFPLPLAADSHRLIASRKAAGKILLLPRE